MTHPVWPLGRASRRLAAEFEGLDGEAGGAEEKVERVAHGVIVVDNLNICFGRHG